MFTPAALLHAPLGLSVPSIDDILRAVGGGSNLALLLMGFITAVALVSTFTSRAKVHQARRQLRAARRTADDAALAAAIAMDLDGEEVMRYVNRGIVPDLDLLAADRRKQAEQNS